MLALETAARCCRRAVQLHSRTSPKRDVLTRHPDLQLDAKGDADEGGVYRLLRVRMFWYRFQISDGKSGWGDIEGNGLAGRKMGS